MPNIINSSQLVLSEDAFDKVRSVIDELANKTRSQLVVFCESNGYPITSKGNLQGVELAGLASLAANNFSATSKIAAMLGEGDAFKYLYHEGDDLNIYVSNVGYNFVLLVVFDKEIALGMVRIFTKKAIDNLSEILRNVNNDEEESTRFFDLEFKTLLTDELNRSLKL
jgi:predicted regulator of Ras-like GTPase activity (Roadblock/LC7/MglB family)